MKNIPRKFQDIKDFECLFLSHLQEEKQIFNEVYSIKSLKELTAQSNCGGYTIEHIAADNFYISPVGFPKVSLVEPELLLLVEASTFSLITGCLNMLAVTSKIRKKKNEAFCSSIQNPQIMFLK